MEEKKYRKLNVELPIEPIRNSQPWLVLGVLFALAILLLMIYLFLNRTGRVDESNTTNSAIQKFRK